MKTLKVLMVTTSYSVTSENSPATGIWLEELAGPYYVFADAGALITLASPEGGSVHIDPVSEASEAQTESTRRLHADTTAMKLLSATLPIATIQSADFDIILVIGGHGAMWDLKDCKPLINILNDFISAHKPIGAIGSGVVALVGLQQDDGSPYVKNKMLTAYSNAEVQIHQLTYAVPFLLESQLLSLGASYSRSADYTTHVVKDGNLITGQNPASAADVAKMILTIV